MYFTTINRGKRRSNINHKKKAAFFLSHHAHVRALRGELPVHDEVDPVRLEHVLQVGDVLGVLVAVQGKAGDLGPGELLEDLKVDVPIAKEDKKIP